MDAVQAMSFYGFGAGEMLAEEAFAVFLGDTSPGEDRGFDPLKDFVPIEQVLDSRPDPLECLLALESGDFSVLRTMFGAIKNTKGRKNRNKRRRFSRLADREECYSEKNI